MQAVVSGAVGTRTKKQGLFMTAYVRIKTDIGSNHAGLYETYSPILATRGELGLIPAASLADCCRPLPTVADRCRPPK